MVVVVALLLVALVVGTLVMTWALGCGCIGGWHCGEGEGQFVNGDRVAANDQTILVNGVAGVNHQIIAILRII